MLLPLKKRELFASGLRRKKSEPENRFKWGEVGKKTKSAQKKKNVSAQPSRMGEKGKPPPDKDQKSADYGG